MSQQPNTQKSKIPEVLTDTLFKVLKESFQIVLEIYQGIAANKIPWRNCSLIGIAFCLLITFRIDLALIHKTRFAFLYPYNHWFYWPYCFFGITSGFWGWGLGQLGLRRKLVKKLSNAFLNAGLKTHTGKLPGFISNTAIDAYTSKLKLAMTGLSKQQFVQAKPSLQSSLQVFIDQFRDNISSGTIEIVYSQTELPDLILLEDIKSIGRYRFTPGNTRGGQVIEDLSDVPHLLIAGQSGGGKSTFLRQFITTMYVNNRNCQFTLIDLKGGLEFLTFNNLPRVDSIPDINSAARALNKFDNELENRMTLLKENECKDLEAYFKIPKDKRKTHPLFKGGSLDRHIVVVDEAAEIFLIGEKSEAQLIQNARRILSRIARQGRAVGIHLVIATQRPDTKSLDSQVKANLSGVLSYPMANDASSITVLGNGRATDLPGEIKGRAIWKRNADMMEVQTPFLSVEETNKLLEPFRIRAADQVPPPPPAPPSPSPKTEGQETPPVSLVATSTEAVSTPSKPIQKSDFEKGA